MFDEPFYALPCWHSSTRRQCLDQVHPCAVSFVLPILCELTHVNPCACLPNMHLLSVTNCSCSGRTDARDLFRAFLAPLQQHAVWTAQQVSYAALMAHFIVLYVLSL